MKNIGVDRRQACSHQQFKGHLLCGCLALFAIVLVGCPGSDSNPAPEQTGSGGAAQPVGGMGGQSSQTNTSSGGGTGGVKTSGTIGDVSGGSTGASNTTSGTGGVKTSVSGGSGGANATATVTGTGGSGLGGTTVASGGTAGSGLGGETTATSKGGTAGGITAPALGGAGGTTVVVTGTGGVGSGGTGGSSAPASLQSLATAFCAAARTCCTQKSYPTAPLADCETQFQSRVRALALVNKGTVVIDTEALATCVAAYKQAATSCSFYDVVDGCGGVFVGTRTAGQTCGSGNQAGGLECKKNGGPTICFWTQSPSDPSITGTCMQMPHAKKSDSCAGTCRSNDDCSVDMYAGPGDVTAFCYQDDGLYCSNDNGVSTCKSLIAKGVACSTIDIDACGDGNYCDWNANTCRQSATLGQSCQTISCLSRYQCTSDYKCSNVPLANDDVCAGSPPVP